jgi:uncharacterized RDD family membrane protein YckC
VPEYASWLRRIAALAIDWIVSTLVTIGFVGLGDYTRPGGNDNWVVLGVFALEVTVLTALAGGSFGQLLVGIRVLSTDGRALNLLLICVVIPPLIFETATGRGLHDRWTRSAAYRRP